MSNLLPKNAVLPLSTGEVITVRALTAFELLGCAKVLKDAMSRLQGEGDVDIVTMLIDLAASHPDDIAKLIALSCTKDAGWAKSLELPDMLQVLAEMFSVNIASQKKTPELLMTLMGRLK